MSQAQPAIAQPTFKNILYTTDFSPCSEMALPYARALAEHYGSTLHMVHVAGPEPTSGELGVPRVDVEVQNLAARERLDELARSDALKGVLFTQTVQRGSVWGVVSRMLADLHIELIVLGTHGRRGLKHFVLGSVAEQIFRRATCPVLTVGPEVRRHGLAKGRVGMILYATDFSTASLQAFRYAQSLGAANRATLALLHALSGTEASDNPTDEAVIDANKRLADLMRQSPQVRCEAIVMSGSAAEGILRAARTAEADIIVMGAHPGASASAHTPWAVAHRVVCHAPCPVLTVRG